eukprot:GGOE01007004.1.p1 GENE.GGOE01007004.1~~GGOE01007004.1.p1  ORF type:complete len:578 (-),score=157.20 GGOE01007004.1:1126-2859(-)
MEGSVTHSGDRTIRASSSNPISLQALSSTPPGWRHTLVIRCLCLGLMLLAACFSALHAALPLSSLPLLALHVPVALLAASGVAVDLRWPQHLPLPAVLLLLLTWVACVDVLYARQLSLQYLTLLIPCILMFCFVARWPWMAAAGLMLAKEAVLWAQWRLVGWPGPVALSDSTSLLIHQLLLFLVSLSVALALLRGQLQGETQQQVSPIHLQQRLQQERSLSRRLVHNILPPDIAEELLEVFQNGGVAPLADGKFAARTHAQATVAFADIVGFTKLAAQCSPQQLVSTLDSVFSAFDEACEAMKVEKIKTIGDCYMCAAIPRGEGEAEECAASVLRLCCQMHTLLQQYCLGDNPLAMRAGMECGTVTAGIIGKMKFCYDIWGDSVNTASRMESTGVVGATQVTEHIFHLLKASFSFTARGPIEVKGKGLLCTWLHWPHEDFAVKRSITTVSDFEPMPLAAELRTVPTGLRTMWTNLAQESHDGCSTCTIPETRDPTQLPLPSHLSNHRLNPHGAQRDIDGTVFFPPVSCSCNCLGMQASSPPRRLPSTSGSQSEFSHPFTMIQPRSDLHAKRIGFQYP